MKEKFRRFRYWLAYAIAPDLIDDLEERLSVLLCHVTGGLLSKTNYTADTMISCADDYQRACVTSAGKKQSRRNPHE